MATEEREGLSWLKIVVAALAAMSSAFVLSTLGVGGTVVGAALGSIVASLSTVAYGHGIRRSTDAIKTQARIPAGRAADAEALADAGADPAVIDDGTEPDESDESDEPDESTGIDPRINWKRVAVVAAALFVVVMIAITVIELYAGKSFSQMTGGSSERHTTVGVGDGSGGRRGDDPSPSPSTSPSDSPSESPSESPTPTDSATPSPTPSGTPTESPSETPSEAPGETPSEGATPAATGTP